MDKYYYLLSQLPYLQFNQEQLITRRYFMEEAQKWLSADEYENVIQASIYDYSPEENAESEILNNYRNFEFQLRMDLASWRKAKQEGHETREVSFPIALLKDESPLVVEKNLIEYRWKFIDDLLLGHYFDLEAVLGYFLKLQLLERLFSFNKEKGKEKFSQLSKIDENPVMQG